MEFGKSCCWNISLKHQVTLPYESESQEQKRNKLKVGKASKITSLTLPCTHSAKLHSTWQAGLPWPPPLGPQPPCTSDPVCGCMQGLRAAGPWSPRRMSPLVVYTFQPAQWWHCIVDAHACQRRKWRKC